MAVALIDGVKYGSDERARALRPCLWGPWGPGAGHACSPHQTNAKSRLFLSKNECRNDLLALLTVAAHMELGSIDGWMYGSQAWQLHTNLV